MYRIVTKNHGFLEAIKKFSKSFERCISSRSASLSLSGVYPPIITTFDDHGVITYEKLHQNLQKWESVPLRGFVVLGTTGEYVSLSDEEKIDLVKYVRKFAPSEKLVIAGSGCESTSATIALTNIMADAGADAALVVNPCYNKSRMTEDVLYEHFVKVAETSKIPIILYNVPGNTGIDMTPSLLIKLADHPNIIGMKESGGDITKIGYIVCKTKNKDFQVLAGSAGFLYSALCLGSVGGIMALANPLPAEVYTLYKLAIDGKHHEARDLQHRLVGPNLCVTKWFGIPGVKASMDLLGFYGGTCRSPLKRLLQHEMSKLTDEFKINSFL